MDLLSMRRYGLAVLMISLLVQLGAAFTQTESGSSLSMQDYFIIFFAAILYVNIFMVVLYRIFKSTGEKKSKFVVVNVMGMLFAFLLISLGYIQIIFSGLVIASVTTDITMFAWAYNLMIYYFGTATFGLILIGGEGFLCLLSGLYILVLLRGSPFSDRAGMPGKSGILPELQVGAEGEEPQNPNITFRVKHRDTDEPAIDMKVILQQRDGSKFYSKYTDFNGEVTFQKIVGYASSYYAFVEGDEARTKFRVIRSRISAESGT
ncbi:MAG: hypothetical protein LUQ40_00890 [Methanomicrobiales archaeon]|nr:hypothetical protein [Methanomicrobiales archaeon]